MKKNKWYALSIILVVVVMSVVIILFDREGDTSSKHSVQKIETGDEVEESVDVPDKEYADSSQGTLSDDERTNLGQATELPIMVAPNGEGDEGQDDKEQLTMEKDEQDTTVESTADRTMELPFVPAE